jgi:hypothetical protein
MTFTMARFVIASVAKQSPFLDKAVTISKHSRPAIERKIHHPVRKKRQTLTALHAHTFINFADSL